MAFYPSGGQFGSTSSTNPQMRSWMSQIQDLLGKTALNTARNQYESSMMASPNPGMVTRFRPGGATYTPFGQGDWLSNLDRLRYAKENYGSLFDPSGSQSWSGLGRVGNLWDKFFGDGSGSGDGSGIPDFNVPGEWGGPNPPAPEADYDPMEVIRSALPGIQEQRDREFASAGKRLGALGALTGSGYGKKLGDISRRATNDITNVWLRTLAGAAENKANRQLTAEQQGAQRSLSAWQTHGGWEMEKALNEYLQAMLNQRGEDQRKYNLLAPLIQQRYSQSQQSIIPALLAAMYGG